jgi:hypothetical protein
MIIFEQQLTLARRNSIYLVVIDAYAEFTIANVGHLLWEITHLITYYQAVSLIWINDERRQPLIERLERLTDEIASLHSKLLLLVGPSNAGKTTLLRAFGKRMEVEPLNVGSELGLRLMGLPLKQRPLEAGSILRTLADQHAKHDLLLIDNIELLFDRTLQLDPLDLLKRQAHVRRILAVWPGELRDGRLTYAHMGHPEQQDYSREGLVLFEIK